MIGNRMKPRHQGADQAGWIDVHFLRIRIHISFDSTIPGLLFLRFAGNLRTLFGSPLTGFIRWCGTFKAHHLGYPLLLHLFQFPLCDNSCPTVFQSADHPFPPEEKCLA